MIKPDRISSTFPHFDDKYKCCCGTVHVLQGGQMVGIVSAILLFFSLFHGFFAKESATLTIFEYILMGIEVICLVLLFVGIKKLRSKFILPFLAYLVLSTFATFLLFIATSIAIVDPDSWFGRYLKKYIDTSDHDDLKQSIKVTPNTNVDPYFLVRIVAVFLDTAILIGLILNAWFAWVIYRCYGYLKDLEEHRERNTSVSFNVEASSIH